MDAFSRTGAQAAGRHTRPWVPQRATGGTGGVRGFAVERFAPDAIKARVTAKGGLLPGSREAALWRAFEGEYKALAHESEAAYLDLFAKNFRKAYERNIKKAVDS
jgi:hypothetical protein